MTDVCVLGLGYIGLPTALLAAQDHDVVGVDIDEARVDAIQNGVLPTDESEIRTLHEDVRERFRATTTVPNASTYVVATPTPVRSDSGVADVSAVRDAAEAIAPTLDPGDTVILESTVPPGTTDRLFAPALARNGSSPDDVAVAYCPERASPGDTLAEMVENDRVVGGRTPGDAAAASEFYDSFVEGRIRSTTTRTAELVKLMENTYRDVNIALANEFALLAEEFGADVHEAIDLANEHPRVNVHRPGPGVGGHCIPVDPQFVTQHSTRDRLIPLAREINTSMAGHVARTVRGALDVHADATVTLLGVAYKGGVSDTRQTPAAPVLELLTGFGYDVRVYDPHVEEFEVDPTPLREAFADSDLGVVLTDHPEFAALDPGDVADQMVTRRLVDTRAVVDRDTWETAGFDVTVLGDGRPGRTEYAHSRSNW